MKPWSDAFIKSSISLKYKKKLLWNRLLWKDKKNKFTVDNGLGSLQLIHAISMILCERGLIPKTEKCPLDNLNLKKDRKKTRIYQQNTHQ